MDAMLDKDTKGGIPGVPAWYKRHAHQVFVWRKRGQNVLSWVFRYLVLIGIAFTLLYPVFFALSTSLKNQIDAVDSTVQWVPRHLSLDNFRITFQLLSYWDNFRTTILSSLLPAILQCLSCAVAGYAFSRSMVKGMNLMMAFLLVALIVPDQAVIVPLYRQYSSYHWLGTFLPYIAPALVGHGLRGALFVLMYRQYFKGQPKELEEAACIDGASSFGIFWRVMFPLAKPLILVVFLFSLVWHWNETFSTSMFQTTPPGLALRLLAIPALVSNGVSGRLASGPVSFDSAIGVPMLMAGSILVMLPLLILYAFAQRYFVEGVERTGIAGE
ncbi:MAG: carbohydrate ABC transporter permease [Patescibacteria group bacterium]